MATTPTRLMTFAEFEKLPNTPRGFPYELRHGELVELAEPTIEHQRAQRRIRLLLEPVAGNDWIVNTEVGFRGLPEVEYRVADLAVLPRERWDTAKDYLFGAPELVVEVLSPSNTAAERRRRPRPPHLDEKLPPRPRVAARVSGEIRDKRKLCLENGSREFWVVDMRQREIEVSTPDGRSVTYKSGQIVPLFFSARGLAVDALFD